jgi:hypothetical protein
MNSFCEYIELNGFFDSRRPFSVKIVDLPKFVPGFLFMMTFPTNIHTMNTYNDAKKHVCIIECLLNEPLRVTRTFPGVRRVRSYGIRSFTRSKTQKSSKKHAKIIIFHKSMILIQILPLDGWILGGGDRAAARGPRFGLIVLQILPLQLLSIF